MIGNDGQVQLLMAHGPGELFGALLRERVFVSDVIARDRIAALEISNAILTRLAQEEARIGSGLAMILARQYHAALERMAARITLSATGRDCAELLNAAGNSNSIAPPPVVAAVGLMAQTTRETASRAINGLMRRGILLREADRLTIVPVHPVSISAITVASSVMTVPLLATAASAGTRCNVVVRAAADRMPPSQSPPARTRQSRSV